MLASRVRLIAAFVLAAIAGEARADYPSYRSCRSFAGSFTSSLVLGPPCTSPLGMCTGGQLTGGLDATYDFTFLTLTPDAKDPLLSHYTGASLITFKNGAHVTGKDVGAMRSTTPGKAQFLTIVTVTGGDHGYQSARGTIAAGGTLDLVTGQATGKYFGRICRAADSHARTTDDDDGEGDDD